MRGSGFRAVLRVGCQFDTSLKQGKRVTRPGFGPISAGFREFSASEFDLVTAAAGGGKLLGRGERRSPHDKILEEARMTQPTVDIDIDLGGYEPPYSVVMEKRDGFTNPHIVTGLAPAGVAA